MIRATFAAVAALSLSACASSVLTVEKPMAQRFTTPTATLVLDQGAGVSIDEDNRTYTEAKMRDAFFGGDSPIFTKGDGMTVRYRYVGFNEGSRAGRYLTMGLAGSSKIVLEADFVAPNGTVISTVRGEGEVRGGMLGGSNKSGIDKAVEEIADYAAANLR